MKHIKGVCYTQYEPTNWLLQITANFTFKLHLLFNPLFANWPNSAEERTNIIIKNWKSFKVLNQSCCLFITVNTIYRNTFLRVAPNNSSDLAHCFLHLMMSIFLSAGNQVWGHSTCLPTSCWLPSLRLPSLNRVTGDKFVFTDCRAIWIHWKPLSSL